MDFDYLVFIGRFEPFHNGHAAVARHALTRAQKLIVLIGSAGMPRTIKNPWSVAERAVMIQSVFADYSTRLLIKPLRDHLYNETQWITNVQRLVAEAITEDSDRPTAPRVGLIGKDKDGSSYYLREFPQWPLVDVKHTESLSATELRHYLFEANQVNSHGGLMLIRANVPAQVYEMLDAFRRSSPAFQQLVAEHQFIQNYRAAWDACQTCEAAGQGLSKSSSMASAAGLRHDLDKPSSPPYNGLRPCHISSQPCSRCSPTSAPATRALGRDHPDHGRLAPGSAGRAVRGRAGRRSGSGTG